MGSCIDGVSSTASSYGISVMKTIRCCKEGQEGRRHMGADVAGGVSMKLTRLEKNPWGIDRVFGLPGRPWQLSWRTPPDGSPSPFR